MVRISLPWYVSLYHGTYRLRISYIACFLPKGDIVVLQLSYEGGEDDESSHNGGDNPDESS